MSIQFLEEKNLIQKAVDSRDEQLRKIALKIHANPELGFQEYKAAKWLIEPLREAEFKIELGIAGLETAFSATWEGKPGGPTIAFLAEYDALPKIGHACGHNIIGTAAVGAALALKDTFPELPAKIMVFGTPAEEGGGGKVIMCEKGVFDGVDAALLCHPHAHTYVQRNAISCVDVNFKFYGKSAHASGAPEKGISALDAIINSFVAINSLRQFFKDGTRVHGIILKGGDAPNVVPDYTEARFILRAPNIEELKIVKEKVYAAVHHSAEAVGATHKIVEGLVYAERTANPTMAKLCKENYELMGVEVSPPPKRGGMGSSDMGNVGQLMPILHPYIKICPETGTTHTIEFCEAAGSEQGMKGLNYGAKVLAMTAYDLCANLENLNQAKEEFFKSRNGK